MAQRVLHTPKNAVRVATAFAALPNSPAYAAGTGGVGATLTATANAALVVDGVTLAVGDEVLVKDQATGLQNGIYEVTTAGSGAAAWKLTRRGDANIDYLMQPGHFVRVTEGTVNAGSTWVNDNATITLGTTALLYRPLRDKVIIKAQSGNFTVTYADWNTLTQVSAAAVITIPTDAAAPTIPVGFAADYERTGAGAVTYAAAAPPTLHSQGGLVAISAQYARATLVKSAANTWELFGSLA